MWITLDLCACAHTWHSSLCALAHCAQGGRERECVSCLPDWFAARWRPENHRKRQLRTFFALPVQFACVLHVYCMCMLCLLLVYCVCTLLACVCVCLCILCTLCTLCNFCHSHLLLQLLLIRDVAWCRGFCNWRQTNGGVGKGARDGEHWNNNCCLDSM